MLLLNDTWRDAAISKKRTLEQYFYGETAFAIYRMKYLLKMSWINDPSSGIQLLLHRLRTVKMLLDRTPKKEDPEKWVKIRGTNNRYSVSNKGEVRKDEYRIRRKNGTIWHNKQVYKLDIKPRTDGKKPRQGLYVKLRVNNGVRIQRNVAYLVANHFLYKPTNAKRLEWIDGDTHNNAAYNLRWK